MPNLKSPLEKAFSSGMRPPEASRVGREKLPPGKLTKDSTQRYKAMLVLVSYLEQLWSWGSGEEKKKQKRSQGGDNQWGEKVTCGSHSGGLKL